MTNLAESLFGIDVRLVFDRTGLAGRYDFHFTSDAPSATSQEVLAAMGTLRRDAVKAIGLKLEESRMPLEVWVIEHAEKPSEN